MRIVSTESQSEQLNEAHNASVNTDVMTHPSFFRNSQRARLLSSQRDDREKNRLFLSLSNYFSVVHSFKAILMVVMIYILCENIYLHIFFIYIKAEHGHR